MGRYTGSVCRQCRREGLKLFLKGTRCYTQKCAIDKRPYPPGQHGQGRVKLSDYGLQLREKQKAKRIFGVFERQFKHYYQIAQKRKGVTGQILLQQLERRLDNTVFRMGFALSRAEGRHLVQHGAIAVNGKRVNIPSYPVKASDALQIMPSADGWKKRVQNNLEITKDRSLPGWLQVDPKQLKGLIVRLPEKDDMGLPLQEQLIVELYSK